MADDFDPLAEIDDPLGALDRDRYGRPLVTPTKRDGTPNPKGKPVPYTRASTFCGYPADKGGLIAWKLRHAVVGLAHDPELCAMVGALGANPDEFTPQAKRDLDEMIEQAHARSFGNNKANHGTAVHSLTEPGNDGFVPDRMAADVTAYQAAMDAHGLKVVDTERFTVCDDMQSAGTFDHKVRTLDTLEFDYDGQTQTIPPGTVLILDKKTGSLHFDEHAIQEATYALGRIYNPETGEREASDASPQWGIVAHIPAGKGECTLYVIDLHKGWEGAKLAAKIRDWRSGAKKLAVKLGDTVKAEAVQPPGATPPTGGDPAAGPEPSISTEPTQAEQIATDKARHEAALAKAHANARAEQAAKAAPNPAPAEPDTREADALADLARGIGARPVRDVILAEINAAATPDAVAAVWRARRREGWDDDVHVPAAKARVAALKAAA